MLTPLYPKILPGCPFRLFTWPSKRSRELKQQIVALEAQHLTLTEAVEKSTKVQLNLHRRYREALDERDEARKERDQARTENNKLLRSIEAWDHDALEKTLLESHANQVASLRRNAADLYKVIGEQTREICRLMKCAEGWPEGMTPADVKNLKDANCRMATQANDQAAVIRSLRSDLDSAYKVLKNASENIHWHRCRESEFKDEIDRLKAELIDLRRDVKELNEIIKRQNVALDNCSFHAEEGIRCQTESFKLLQFRNIIQEVKDAIQERKAA